MPVTDDDCAIILNALFDYGMTNRERAEGMPAQGLYLRLNRAEAFHFTNKPAVRINAASGCQRAGRIRPWSAIEIGASKAHCSYEMQLTKGYIPCSPGNNREFEQKQRLFSHRPMTAEVQSRSAVRSGRIVGVSSRRDRSHHVGQTF